MNKRELAAKVASDLDMKRNVVEAVLGKIADVIVETVANGDEVRIDQIGKFSNVYLPAREGTNPHTKEPMKIEARNKPRFRPSANFKRVVKNTLVV